MCFTADIWVYIYLTVAVIFSWVQLNYGLGSHASPLATILKLMELLSVNEMVICVQLRVMKLLTLVTPPVGF